MTHVSDATDRRAASIPTVDVHAHVAVPAVDALIDGQPGLAAQRRTDAATLGPASLELNLQQMAEIGPKLLDLDRRLAAMDAARVDVQAVSAVPLPHAWADRDLAERIVVTTNDSVAAFCATSPTASCRSAPCRSSTPTWRSRS